MSVRRFRGVGFDPATGKEAFVVARPGGFLEELPSWRRTGSGDYVTAVKDGNLPSPQRS